MTERLKSLPLPDDPNLAAWASALNDAGHWAYVYDSSWRHVFATDELRMTHGDTEAVTILPIGFHLCSAEATRFRATVNRGRFVLPEARRAHFLEWGPYFLANPGDFVPQPAPTVGGVVDTFRVLAVFGVPGAAEVVSAFNDVGSCELRTRFTNVEAPPVPPGAALVAPTPLPTPPNQAVALPAVEPFNVVAAVPRAPITTPTRPASATSTDLPVPVGERLPAWLQWLAIGALIGFLYRAIAPRREQAF